MDLDEGDEQNRKGLNNNKKKYHLIEAAKFNIKKCKDLCASLT